MQGLCELVASTPPLVVSLKDVAQRLASDLEALHSKEARANSAPGASAALGRFAQLRQVAEGLQRRVAESEERLQVCALCVCVCVCVR